MSAVSQAQVLDHSRVMLYPSTATAAIDIRLVQGVTVESQIQRVVEHIRKQGYFVVDREPDAGTRLAYPKMRDGAQDGWLQRESHANGSGDLA